MSESFSASVQFPSQIKRSELPTSALDLGWKSPISRTEAGEIRSTLQEGELQGLQGLEGKIKPLKPLKRGFKGFEGGLQGLEGLQGASRSKLKRGFKGFKGELKGVFKGLKAQHQRA